MNEGETDAARAGADPVLDAGPENNDDGPSSGAAEGAVPDGERPVPPVEGGWDEEGGDVFFGEMLEPYSGESQPGGAATSSSQAGGEVAQMGDEPGSVADDVDGERASSGFTEKLNADTAGTHHSAQKSLADATSTNQPEPEAMEESTLQREKKVELTQQESLDAEREALEMEQEAQRLLLQVQRLREAAEAKRKQQSLTAPITQQTAPPQPPQQPELRRETETMRQQHREKKQEVVQRPKMEAEKSKRAPIVPTAPPPPPEPEAETPQKTDALSRMERLEREWERQTDQAKVVQIDHEQTSPASSPGSRHKGSGITHRRHPRGATLEASASASFDEADDDDDIESQSKKYTKPFLKRRDYGAVRADVKVVLRKIAHAILSNPDDDTLRLQETEPVVIVITLLKEVMLGAVIAFLLICFFMLLDQALFLNLPTSHNAHRAAAHLFEEEGGLQKIEEEAGLKFVPIEEYKSMLEEIKEAPKKIKFHENDLAEKSKNFEQTRKERSEAEIEYPKLFNKLHLDRFCETCVWSSSQKVTCNQRAEALEDTYKTPKFEAILSAMEKKACWKSDEQMAEDKKNREVEETYLQDWVNIRKDFCSDCEWQGYTTCHARAGWLTYRYGLGFDRARARLMSESDKCKVSFHEEAKKKLEDKLSRFCKECSWGNNLTCQQRVEFLQYTYKTAENEAVIDAMKKPACIKQG